MSESVRTSVVVVLVLLVLLVLVGWSVQLTLAGHDGLGELVVIVPVMLAMVPVELRRRRLAKLGEQLCAPERPAITDMPSMHHLMEPGGSLTPLMGRVRMIRTYSLPLFVENGGVIPRYHSVLIDTHDQLHDLEDHRSFARVEQRAQSLAKRLGVPFESMI